MANENKSAWPISQRGKDLEESFEQMKAKDRMNQLTLDRMIKNNPANRRS